jgi:glycosyltransferase involved in cell wall biosynthesis
MLKKTKILFVVPDLYSGGAQRVFMNLVKGFSRELFDITLVTLIRPNNEYFKTMLPADIRVVQHNFRNTRNAFWTLISLIRRENPQIVFSTLTHLNVIMAMVRFFVSRKILFVARESNTISSSLQDEKFPWLFRWLYKLLYQNFDLIICQSRAMAHDLVTNFNINPSILKVVYNPVDINLISASIHGKSNSNNSIERVELLCVGRLSNQKGFDRVLKILSLLPNFEFRLRIIGDGPLKDNLMRLSITLRLNDRVEFLGLQENPFQFMVDSDCLLLPSYYEGLPNVVLEANACGLPVIAFDSPGGTAEIIAEGLNGWLITDGDLEQFARKIEGKEYLALNKKEIVRFVTERFSLGKIILEYERAILSLSVRSND